MLTKKKIFNYRLQKLPDDSAGVSSLGLLPDNRLKNRFTNVLPCKQQLFNFITKFNTFGKNKSTSQQLDFRQLSKNL